MSMPEPPEIEVFYRTDGHDVGPRAVKLEIPGWAGDKSHGDGAKPQPWHCMPWIEGGTYGIELIFPYDEYRISTRDGKLVVEGGHHPDPPFKAFAPGHYGYGSAIDIQVPAGHALRLESHPRFFTDHTGTVPIVVPGHIQTEWWTRTFFIVFKAPPEGQTHIFRKGEPFAQAIAVPHKAKYTVNRMTPEQAEHRIRWEKITYLYDQYIGQRVWTAEGGGRFNDKYKVMARAFRKRGLAGIEELFSRAAFRSEVAQKPACPRESRVTRRFIKVKKRDES